MNYENLKHIQCQYQLSEHTELHMATYFMPFCPDGFGLFFFGIPKSKEERWRNREKKKIIVGQVMLSTGCLQQNLGYFKNAIFRYHLEIRLFANARQFTRIKQSQNRRSAGELSPAARPTGQLHHVKSLSNVPLACPSSNSQQTALRLHLSGGLSKLTSKYQNMGITLAEEYFRENNGQ